MLVHVQVFEPESVLSVLVLFCAARNTVVVLFGEDADSAGGDFVLDYGLLVLAYGVVAEFFGQEVSKDSKK